MFASKSYCLLVQSFNLILTKKLPKPHKYRTSTQSYPRFSKRPHTARMKTCSDFLPNQNYIDTAQMRAAYERLTALTLVMIEQKVGRGFLAHCRKVVKCVREFTRADWHNQQLELKLRMLASKTWRERVLKELGGEAALKRWDERMSNYRVAIYLRAMGLLEKSDAPKERVWRKTAERIAKELWQIAHAQKCAKAAAHPLIFRDPFRVDFDGQFRLAAVLCLRGTRRSPEVILATDPYYMERYEYDAMRVTKMTGFYAPVVIYPAEFRAAARVEEENELTSVIPHKTRRVADAGPNIEDMTLPLGPASPFHFVRDDKILDNANDQPP
jgi:hypothetical protein